MAGIGRRVAAAAVPYVFGTAAGREEKMAELQEVLDTIRHKCWYYETAIAAGTEKIHFHDETFAGDGCLKDMEEKP